MFVDRTRTRTSPRPRLARHPARHQLRATQPSPTEASPAVPVARVDRSLRPVDPSVTVVIPTLNEARNLPYAMWRLPDIVTEVIVVDGNSSDDTVQAATQIRPGVRIVVEPAPGKGAALRRGFAEATGDIVVMLDADGSADGAEIRRFVDVLRAGADVAKGSRFLPGGGSADLTRIRRLGNQALTGLVNLTCQSRFSDLCYGYNAFWRDCLQFIDVDVSGFEVETRLAMSAIAAGFAVVEVPSYEFTRVHGASNLRAVRDGTRVLRTIVATSKQIRTGWQPVQMHSSGVDRSLYEQARDAVAEVGAHAAERDAVEAPVAARSTQP